MNYMEKIAQSAGMIKFIANGKITGPEGQKYPLTKGDIKMMKQLTMEVWHLIKAFEAMRGD